MKKNRIITVAVLLALFAVLTWSIDKSEFIAFEVAVYQWFAGFISPALTNIAIAITNLGSHTSVIVALALLLLLPATRMNIGIPMVINSVVAASLNLGIKLIIARPRPEVLRLITETGYGFPSGHAMNNAAFYAMLTLLVFGIAKNTRVKTVVLLSAITLTALIGASRIYLGVHNTGDVLAGWALGVAISICTDTVWQALKAKNGRLA